LNRSPRSKGNMTTKNGIGWGSEDLPQTETSKNIDSFPEEWKDDFEGLLFLGYLQREVTKVPFHKFVVRTLTINEKLEISLLTKPYLDTVGYARSYKSAIVAAGLVSVDDRDLIPGNKNINVVRQKYDYVVNNWYDTIIDILYEEIDSLENRVIMVLQELGIIEPVVPFDIFEKVEEELDIPKDGK